MKQRFKTAAKVLLVLLIAFWVNFALYNPPTYVGDEDLLLPGVATRAYAVSAIAPHLNPSSENEFENLLVVAKVLVDSKTGVGAKSTEVNKYFVHHFLEKARLGYLYRTLLPNHEAELLKRWDGKYMREEIPGVFFAPSGEEIILTRAAFGCSHYSRAFFSAANALNIPKDAERLRYAICCKADDYNHALDTNDKSMTINGHQFAIYQTDNRDWVAINTSKAEYVKLPQGFSPEAVTPPLNTSVEFPAYPGITFLFRAVSKDSQTACHDDSLLKLMNIYRSGTAEDSTFKWKRFE